MNVANPKAISELLTCTRKKFQEVAERNGMKASIASVVREHWIRRLTGVCVRCGHYVKDGECPKCQTKALPGITLLEQLDPRTNIIQGQCPKCKKGMTFKVGFVLQIVRRTGAFRPHGLCRQCQQQRRDGIKKVEVKRTPSPQSVQSKIPMHVKTAAKTTSPKKLPRITPRPLTHRPFSVLKGLKIEKEG